MQADGLPGEGEGEGGEEGDAPLGRADQWDEAEMPTLMSGQQYTVPHHLLEFLLVDFDLNL